MDDRPPESWPRPGGESVPETGDPYVIHYSVSPGSLIWIATCVVLTVSLARLGITTGDPSAWTMLLFVGGFGLFLVVVHVTRFGKLALRIDSRGLTFGGVPLSGRRETNHFVPWSAIGSVVIYRTYLYRVQRFGPVTGRFIGVRGIEAPIVLPGRPDPVADPAGFAALLAKLRRSVPHVPPDVSYAGHRIWGWWLTPARLVEAVGRFAPRVEVVDAG